MRLVELRLYVALCRSWSVGWKQKQLLPHLAPEFAPHGTPSLADRLLDNADRMVRLDLFRMGRIVELYSNCLLGLVLWRQTLPGSEHGWAERSALRRRQKQMREKMLEVVKSFARRILRRKELDKRWRSTRLEKCVEDYIHLLIGPVDERSIDTNENPTSGSHVGRISSVAKAEFWRAHVFDRQQPEDADDDASE
jgi:hypothetical protein